MDDQKRDNYMETFTIKEIENIFELGRMAQYLAGRGMIGADSKELFNFALSLAIEFEEKYPETEEYYTDIDEFATEKFMEAFAMED